MSDRVQDVAAIMRRTRALLMPYYGKVEAVHEKGRGSMDFVTKLDLEIEEYLRVELDRLDSSIEFAGEEFGGTREAERLWLCDPIDGTIHFIRGLPFCTVMLALIERNEVTLSFIYDFVNDNLYHAVRGGGAYLNGEPICVSNRPAEDAVIGWETNINRTDLSDKRTKWIGTTRFRPVARLLCSGYEFALVASGKLDGRVQVEPYGKDWDFAPGSLLVAEAGGVVANVGTTTYDYRNTSFIAANKAVYIALTEGSDAPFPAS